MTARRVPTCQTCGRPVRWWQKRDWVGPMGCTRKTAAVLWHSKCGLRGES